MKRFIPIVLIVPLLLAFYDCGPKVRPQSEVDTPQYHFRAGMRYLDGEDYRAAIGSFQRSVDLDKKFAPGWAGRGLATGLQGDLKQGRKYMEKALDRGKKNAAVHVLAGRLWIAHRDVDKKWLKKAKREFERALDLKPNHEAALYYLGVAYLNNYDFSLAEEQFRKVVDRKGDLADKANKKWALAQKIVRAQPGTPAGKKIALQPRITRADLAVLLVEELKLTEIFERFLPQSGPTFQSPAQASGQVTASLPKDVKGHWAERWIAEAIKLGVFNLYPDGSFAPNEHVTRANYAMAIQKILSAVTRDPGLETRYFGESQSRFSDVASSHFAYNAIAVCVDRGIMKADLITRQFNPAGTVNGADALLIIRELQNSLRMTF